MKYIPRSACVSPVSSLFRLLLSEINLDLYLKPCRVRSLNLRELGLESFMSKKVWKPWNILRELSCIHSDVFFDIQIYPALLFADCDWSLKKKKKDISQNLCVRGGHMHHPGLLWISPQESMVIQVPRFKDIPTDVSPNLQDRLNGVTDVLSRVSKLVSEDLEKAVSTAVGQDKDGNMSSGDWCSHCSNFTWFAGSLFPSLCSCVLKLFIHLQVLLRIRGRSLLWFPVQLLRATLVGRRASVLVSPV